MKKWLKRIAAAFALLGLALAWSWYRSRTDEADLEAAREHADRRHEHEATAREIEKRMQRRVYELQEGKNAPDNDDSLADWFARRRRVRDSADR
jgi:hypothetical protein